MVKTARLDACSFPSDMRRRSSSTRASIDLFNFAVASLSKSVRWDLNSQSSRPKRGALTRFRYWPYKQDTLDALLACKHQITSSYFEPLELWWPIVLAICVCSILICLCSCVSFKSARLVACSFPSDMRRRSSRTMSSNSFSFAVASLSSQNTKSIKTHVFVGIEPTRFSFAD